MEFSKQEIKYAVLGINGFAYRNLFFGPWRFTTKQKKARLMSKEKAVRLRVKLGELYPGESFSLEKFLVTTEYE